MKKKKVLFYIYPEWAFGRIFNDMIKACWPDVHCDLLPWAMSRTHYEMELFNKKYDYFVSTTDGAESLVNQGIPYNKIIAIACAHRDIDIIKKYEYVPHYHEYAVICESMIQHSLKCGVSRIPNIIRQGTFVDLFARDVRHLTENAPRIGYYARIEREENGQDIKRGFLVQRVCQDGGYDFIHTTNINMRIIEALYENIDFYMFSSLLEGNPMGAIESCASGIPVLGTDTGIMRGIADAGAGIILPFEEDEYVKQGISAIESLRADKEKYVAMSKAALEYSRAAFDWHNIIHDFKNIL